jgi:hypothetical protein
MEMHSVVIIGTLFCGAGFVVAAMALDENAARDSGASQPLLAPQLDSKKMDKQNNRECDSALSEPYLYKGCGDEVGGRMREGGQQLPPSK